MPNGLVRPDVTHSGWQHRGYDHNIRCRKAWVQLIAETAADGHLLTLGFHRYLDHDRAIQVGNAFLLRMNRWHFGKRFRCRGKSLTGFVVLEEKRHSSRSSKSPHFHFALAAGVDGYPNTQTLRKTAERASHCLRYPTLERHRPFGPVISGPALVDVRKSYDPVGLADYLTKDCDKLGPVREALNIAIVTMHGIVGLSAIPLGSTHN